MERIPINPGTVDWAGENPGMYLKQEAEGPYVTLITFFRVVRSAHGRGHAAFIFQDPHGDGRGPGKSNICTTDNEPLARYLRDNFVAHFAVFKGTAALANCRFEKGTHFVTSGDTVKSHTEQFRGDSGEVTLTWEPLGDAFFVELPKEKSSTRAHEMFSVFVNASGVRVTIGGRPVAGRPFPREVHGRASSTAFLALAETWVRR